MVGTEADLRKQETSRQLAKMEMLVEPVDKPMWLNKAIKVPIGEIATLGAAFVSLSDTFRTVTQTAGISNGGTLMRAFWEDGSPVSISQLSSFKSGAGSLGSGMVGGSFRQAHFVSAGPQALTTTATLPVDPATLALAIATQQVNQKLDAIQKTVDDMFEYMRERDKAEMCGNLQTLVDLINNFGLNMDNEMYVSNAHMKVLDIMQRARQDMVFLRGRTEKKLLEKPPVELRGMVEARLDAVLDTLKDYQLSLYMFAFASFLEPMLSENYKREKLEGISRSIEAESTRYREIYTRVYDAIEGSARASVDTALLGGISLAGKFLGDAVAATPLGEYTPLDDVLHGAGEGVDKFNEGRSDHLLEKLRQAKSPDIHPFQESIKRVDYIYNEPTELLLDGESLYLAPAVL